MSLPAQNYPYAKEMNVSDPEPDGGRKDKGRKLMCLILDSYLFKISEAFPCCEVLISPEVKSYNPE